MKGSSHTSSNIPVILFRLLVPISIFIHPFWGGIASLIADDLDVILIDLFKLKKFSDYPKADKLLDHYYLTFEMLVSLSWVDPFAKTISVFLYIFRTIGLILYLLTNNRKLLLFFPNIFEYYFLIYLGIQIFYQTTPSLSQQLAIVIILTPLKILQEYVLHYRQIKPYERLKRILSNKTSN